MISFLVLISTAYVPIFTAACAQLQRSGSAYLLIHSQKKFHGGLPEWGLNKAPGGYLALHRYAVTQCELFRKLKPIAGAAQTLRRLSENDIRIRIITHRLYIKYFHQQAIDQTIEWLDRYDIPYWDLCFMKDKAAVGADLYIDDSPENVKRLRAGDHDTIIFTNSTNRDLEGLRANNWTEVESIVLARIEEWKSKTPNGGLSGR